MHRRTLLRRGAALGALALAGCTGGDGPPATDGDGTPTPTEPPTSAPPTTAPPSREIADFSFEVTGIEASGEPTADVRFDAENGVVRFTGVIQGKNGCKTAALDAIDYDREADEVTLAVRTKDRPNAGDACTQQLVFVAYEATVTFTGGVPKRAAVRHAGREILSGAHDSASASEPSDA